MPGPFILQGQAREQGMGQDRTEGGGVGEAAGGGGGGGGAALGGAALPACPPCHLCHTPPAALPGYCNQQPAQCPRGPPTRPPEHWVRHGSKVQHLEQHLLAQPRLPSQRQALQRAERKIRGIRGG